MIRRLWWLGLQTLTCWLGATFFRFRAHGIANVPRTGGIILACNHQSYFDPVIASAALSRSVTFMARDTLFKKAPFRFLIESLNAFPVQRGKADLGAMKQSLRRLRDGWPLLVFPEGTRTKDGSIGSMRGGIGVLASRARVPVVPTLILGAFEAWPRDAKLPHPSPIEVRYGKPLPDDIAWDADKVGPALEEALNALRFDRRAAYGIGVNPRL
ncbi:MAG: 1-acyl-sn-glycerol-3-phosphate [Planctomycetota bacterium]|nr:MAG: 1-acyl-sn-glycerol-3-phosphate [Planctomycetota bacterium]